MRFSTITPSYKVFQVLSSTILVSLVKRENFFYIYFFFVFYFFTTVVTKIVACTGNIVRIRILDQKFLLQIIVYLFRFGMIVIRRAA